MTFSIKNSIKLLSPEYFKETFTKNNCEFLISVFKDKNHSFLIPNENFTSQNAEENKRLLKNYADNGYEFSYYVPKNINGHVKNYIEQTGLKFDYAARYVFKEIDKTYSLEDKELIDLDAKSFDKFLNAAKICFPGWNNLDFTRWCLDCPYVRTMAVVDKGEISAFAGYFLKPENNLVLLMNAATMPNFRRQGLHEYLIKKRINEVLKLKRKALVYADVDDGEASHQGLSKLGFENADVFIAYN